MLAIGLIVAFALGVFRIHTKDGVIVLENVPADAVVEVDGEKITVTPAKGEPVKIEAQPGKRVVLVKRGDDVLLGQSVTVVSGKSLALSVRIVAPKPREAGPSSHAAVPRYFQPGPKRFSMH